MGEGERRERKGRYYETEAPRGSATCSRPHSREKKELDTNLGLSGSRTPSHLGTGLLAEREKHLTVLNSGISHKEFLDIKNGLGVVGSLCLGILGALFWQKPLGNWQLRPREVYEVAQPQACRCCVESLAGSPARWESCLSSSQPSL